MSTRAQIQFEGNPVLIYKHCDGYPEGVLPLLGKFVKSFMKDRGWDEEYMVAQYLHDLTADTYYEGKRKYTGYGASTTRHSDIEYFYLVKEDGTIKTEKV